MNNDKFVDFNKAIKITGKSKSTIRRFISQYKDNKDAIKIEYDNKGGFKYLILEDLLIEKYGYSNGYSRDCSYGSHLNSPNDPTENKALMILQKQHNDIIKDLLEKQKNKTPLLRHSTFWTAIVATTILMIIVSGLCIIGYYYKQELQSTHSTKVIELREELQETRTAYRSAINRIDLLHEEYNDKLENKDKAHKIELTREREKLQQLQQELSQQSQPQSFGTTE